MQTINRKTPSTSLSFRFPPQLRGIEGGAGFTLVELLVVITIIAIISTIGFIGFKGYLKDTRDANRVSTIKSLESGIEILAAQNRRYPMPESDGTNAVSSGVIQVGGTTQTYSYLGVIGETISKQMGLSKKPIDPLTGENYIYATNLNRKTYQIATILEGNISAGIVQETYASSKYKAKVIGNHQIDNVIKVGTNYYITTIPSLIFDNSQNTASGNVLNTGSTIFIVDGKENIPKASKLSQINDITADEMMKEIRGKDAKMITEDITALKTGSKTMTEWLQSNVNAGIIVASLNAQTSSGTTAMADIPLLEEIILGKQRDLPTTQSGMLAVNTDCQATTYSGYTITTLQHGQINVPFSKTVTNGNKNITATCINGILSFGPESLVCNTNYVNSSGSCIVDTCAGSTPANSQLNGTQGTASWAYSETAGICKYKCQSNFHTEDSGVSCISNTKACTITNGTGLQTWTTSWGTCTVASCNSGYTQSGNTCIINNYTITFNGNGATSGTMSGQVIQSGNSANLTANAYLKTGYTFAGWSTTSTGTVQYTNSQSYTMGTSNVTLYAVWNSLYTPENCFIFSAGSITDYSTGTVGCGLNVNIPQTISGTTVTIIGTNAFKNKLITSVTIPNGVTTINQSAFQNNQLTSIVIPNSVTNIGAMVFYTNKLTSVTISTGITSIGMYAFFDNPNLTSATNYDTYSTGYIYYKNGTGITINQYLGGTGVLSIPSIINTKSVIRLDHASFYTRGLTNVTIPSSVTSIGNSSFEGNLLTNITIPNTITTISDSAFMSNKLTSVNIPNSVTKIGNAAFELNQLASITIPTSVTYIGVYSFYGNKLTSVTIPSSVTSIGTYAFASQTNSAGGGTVYGPDSGYVYTTYTNNTNSEFDKTKLPNYVDISILSCSSAGQTFSTTSKYTGCDTNDLVVCSGVGTGQIWSMCNAGATTAWTGQTFATQTGARNSTINARAGGLYQWGNNTELSIAATGATTPTCSTGSTFSGSTFVVSALAPYDWCSTQTDDVWGGVTNTNIAMKGPCSTGYHVPTSTEWANAVNQITGKTSLWGPSDVTNLQNILKLPLAGGRAKDTGGTILEGAGGFYSSSTPYTTNAYTLYLTTTAISTTNNLPRANAFSIRCIKN